MIHSQILHGIEPRSLRGCSLAICMKSTTPLWPSTWAGRGSNLLRVDVTGAHVELFSRHQRLEGKNPLLDLTMINLTVINFCACTNLDKEAKRPGGLMNDAVKRKYSEYRDTSPATYTPFRWLCRCMGPRAWIPRS